MTCFRMLFLLARALCLAAGLLVADMPLHAAPVMRTVKVAVFPFPPAIFVDEADGKVKGFYVDMLREVASREHWELQFVQGTWADGLERARKDEVDLLTSVAFTPERATFLDYGQEPSFTVWSLLYAHPKAGIQSILDLKDRSVAVMRNDANGANFRKLSAQFGIPITFLELGSFVDVMKAVESRQVEAGVTPNSFGYFSEHDYRVVRTPVVVNPFSLFFAVGKGKNADLLPALDRFLAENRGTPQSRHAQIVDRWLNPSHRESLSPWVMRGFLLALALLGLSLGAVVVFRRKVRQATHEIYNLNHDLRRELEARLASEENLAITLHSIGDAVLATDTEGLITRMNSTAERLTGWPLAEALGRPLTEVFHIANALTREQSEDPVQKVLAHGEVVGLANHTVLLAQDGQEYQIADSAAPIRDAAGKILGVVLVFSDVTEKYRLEETLARTTDLLKNATEIAKIGGWELELSSMKLTWSPGTYRLHDLDPLTPIDVASGITFYAPEARPVISAAVQAAIESGAPYDLDLPMVTAKGRAFWARAQCNPVTENGRVTKLVGAFQDITDRKQAEAALKESEDRWMFAIEGAGDGLWDWNVQTGKAYFSPRYKEMYGYADADIGTTSDEWSKRIHPDDAPGVFAELQPYMEGKPGSATVEFRMLCKDGSWRWTLGRGRVVSRDFDGKPTRMIGINTDISEQKKTKDALVAQSTALTAVIDNNPMSIQLLDKVGRTTRTNPAFLKLFGATPPPDYSIFSDPTLASQGLSALFDRIQAGEVIYFPEVPYNVHNIFPEFPDTPVWVRTLGFPIIDVSGRPERFVLMHEDVSQRRNAEQVRAELQAQLQQSQKMESLGTLAGGVAHDMNNVLGAILGLASAHIGSHPYGSPLHQALDTICKATERGGKMVKSLLNFARQTPAENNKLNMNAILKEQVALLERTTLAKVRLEIDLEANLRPILGDASALTHAFMNLCVNAVDAMPENGTLTLHTRNVDNDWIEVVVEDNGTGMSKEVLEKAMEPFYTTKETGKGTGLGLSMVFSTVKAHRGQISIKSEQGKGTRVMMRFPACEQEAPAQAAASAVTETALAPHGPMKVLLIDDDDLIQSSVLAILEVLGHTVVTTAQSGEEALALLEAGLEADLVILDMNMPGLGGIGTLPRLRVLRPELPVLLATGRVDQTAMTLASAHPGVTLLSKPFGLRELQKHLENIGLG